MFAQGIVLDFINISMHHIVISSSFHIHLGNYETRNEYFMTCNRANATREYVMDTSINSAGPREILILLWTILDWLTD